MAAKTEEFSKVGFAKSYLLPVVLIAVGPLFSLWFFGYAERSLDDRVRESILRGIRNDRSLKEPDRKTLTEVYGKFSASKLLANDAPELAAMRKQFDQVSNDYWQFRLAKQFSWLCLITAFGAFLLGGLAVLISLKSQTVQYWSFAAGWHMLKLVCALQVVLQGILAVALSFWVTALLAERYYIKLIVLAALCAFAAVAALVGAIFKKLDLKNEVSGVVLDPERAPSFWARVEQMTATLKIPKPDQIIVGIDTNFFVTELPITLDGNEIHGKTLFMSLPMLKILEKEEAASIMAHEMGHFSGQDTLYSRKIAPIRARYIAYLEALYEQPLARPVFYFMLFFFQLFELSLRKTSREREFRADAIAVQLTSAQAFASAMIKVHAYTQYRGQVESKLFDQEAVMESARIAAGIAEGFPAFVAKGLSLEELGDATTTHPFDTHPPVHQRLSAVGVTLDPKHKEEILLTAVQQTWNSEITGADELEAAQWKAYEEAFRLAHEKSLAYRYLPATEAEQKLVEQYFPPVDLGGVLMDFATLKLAAWDKALRLEHIENCRGEDGHLIITYRTAPGGTAIHKIATASLPDGGRPFIQLFSAYYGRHLTAKEYQKVKAAKEKPE